MSQPTPDSNAIILTSMCTSVAVPTMFPTMAGSPPTTTFIVTMTSSMQCFPFELELELLKKERFAAEQHAKLYLRAVAKIDAMIKQLTDKADKAKKDGGKRGAKRPGKS